ncbi:hypothetical protein A2U01_0061772, partial [Trifolium medium]|nr:hypothetical protein [Trifolium medium]
MNFWWKFAQFSIECFGRFIYQRKAASYNVPENSLHFRCSEAPMMAVWVPTAIKCSSGSVFPSNEGRWGVLKLSGTLASHRACARGWASTISSSSSCSTAFFARS